MSSKRNNKTPASAAAAETSSVVSMGGSKDGDQNSSHRRRSDKRLSYLRRYDIPTILKERKETRKSINLQDAFPSFGGGGGGGGDHKDDDRRQTEHSQLLKHSSNLISRPIEMFRKGLRLGHDNDCENKDDGNDIETGDEINNNNSGSSSNNRNDDNKKAEGWKVVKKHMNDGDFLLERLLENGNSNGSNNTYGSTGRALANEFGSKNETFYSCTASAKTTRRAGSNITTTTDHDAVSTRRLRQEAMEQYQNDITLSPKTCLLAIGIYLILSIFAFCFILEPEWTVIDSCYFAVTTFTTTGKFQQFYSPDVIVLDPILCPFLPFSRSFVNFANEKAMVTSFPRRLLAMFSLPSTRCWVLQF